MLHQIHIQIVSGPLSGQKFSFSEPDLFLIGRSPDCHLSLPEDKSLSELHLLLDLNPPNIFLRSNGITRVNGTAAKEAELKDGDTIAAGDTQLQIKVEEYTPCSECEKPISSAEKKTALFGGSLLCEDCFSRGVTLKMIEPSPRPLQCERCGKIVAGQLTQRQKSYLCGACSGDPQHLVSSVSPRLIEKFAERREPTPQPIVGYHLLDILGSGGAGVVFLAQRHRDGVMVAIKMLHAPINADENLLRKFIREVQLVQQMEHPNIIRFIEFGRLGTSFYFVMECCRGGDLWQALNARGYYEEGKSPQLLHEKEALLIFMPVLEALSYAHHRGLVHRDIKPQNILFKDQELKSPTLADFGLAKSFLHAGGSNMTNTNEISGTLRFMPREQLTQFKYLRPRADVFSVGATLYHMLTGLYPYPFEPRLGPLDVIMNRNTVSIAIRRPELPLPLIEVIDRATSVDLNVRYETASHFQESLYSAASECGLV